MSWLRLGSLSAGSLATALLLGVITGYLLSLRNKTPDTWFLVGYFGSLFVLLTGYTLRYSLLTPAALGLAQPINLIVFGVVSLVQFAYHYGGNRMVRESRVALVVTLGLGLAAWVGDFLVPGAPVIYDFEAGYYSYWYGPWVSFAAFGGYLWASVVLTRKWIRSARSTEPASPAGPTRSFALLTIATTMLSVMYLMFQSGIVSRYLYTTVFNAGSLVICLLIFVTYVGSAPQATTYLARLVGVPLAAILVTFGLVSSVLAQTFIASTGERYERDAELALAGVVSQDSGRLPRSVMYVSALPESRMLYVAPSMDPEDALRAGSATGERGPLRAREGEDPLFVKLDIRDPSTFFFHYDRSAGGTSFRIGFSYEEYRLLLHRFASILALAAVGTAFLLLLLLPIVFERSLLRPLRALLRAVREVEGGNYGLALPVSSGDEVGDLARGYNRMVGALRSAEGNFKALAENANDAILILSPEGRVEYSNSRASALSGFERAELLGRSIRDLVPPKEAPELERRLASRLAGDEISDSHETAVLTKSGAAVPVELSGARTQWRDRPAVVVILRDLSERKRSESMLRDQQRRLHQAERLAAMGALVAGVAHEVSNPNQVISLNARLLSDALPSLFTLAEEAGKVDEAVKVAGMPYGELKRASVAAAGDIRESSGRISHIVTELKALVRGGVSGKKDPTDLNQVVRSVVALSQHVIGKATDRFTLDLAAGIPEIDGDRIGLEQVVLNLLENACLAVPDRSRGIEIATSFDAAALSVLLEVRDQGVGIEPENLKRLTEAFYTTRREAGGTGLGLSVSARIVREHGGTLSFASEPGMGTTASVRLPALTRPGT